MVGDHEVGDGVPVEHEAFVVAGADGLEEGGAGGEERNVLNIGVMLLREC